MISNIRSSPLVLARLAACLAILALWGCVPLPATHVEKREFERNIDEQSMLAFAIGKTTRREILLNLGQPDGVMDDERTFIYLADATEAGYKWRFLYALPAGPYSAVVGLTPETAGPQSEERYRLTVWFDEQGLVKNYKFERAEQK
jgi:outer membrane protein assembly factor BamE (lipoprotein component of BamABCDE complex)